MPADTTISIVTLHEDGSATGLTWALGSADVSRVVAILNTGLGPPEHSLHAADGVQILYETALRHVIIDPENEP